MSKIVGKGIYEKISKEEFCRATRTKDDCWMFENVEKPTFWKTEYDGTYKSIRYFYDDGRGVIRQFKDMPEYGEIWTCQRNAGQKQEFSMWGTWTQY